MQAWHTPEDHDKIATLAASMDQDGWIGVPLVRYGDDQLITGAHRYAAARSLDWIDADIPTIDIADIFAEVGQDFAAVWDGLMREGWAFDVAMVEAIRLLPADALHTYGIDIT